MLRPAGQDDLDALVALEERCFETDRLSRRRFRHFIASRTACCLVALLDGVLVGYVLVLLHGRTALARLYSMAVAPEAQGAGLGRALLAAAEGAALDRGAAVMRLEVRPDNARAIALYRSMGYVEFGIYHDFYEDDSDALRMEHPLIQRRQVITSRVPHFTQSLEFTCGPAALMMAMHALDASIPLDRRVELQIWRESTTIFMTSGHGGCSPHGLALAAWRRGFKVELFVNHDRPPFLDSVRHPDKKAVVQLVHQVFLEDMAASDIAHHRGPFAVQTLVDRFTAGAMVIVLISQYRIIGDKAPHWIILSGFDHRFIYVHDPYIGDLAHDSSSDCVSIPILPREFELMARYGERKLQAAVVLYPRGVAG
jgi:ribosomal-protein-alanine acetyltransferase